MKNVVFRLILLLAATGCTVLEDRLPCPCYLDIDYREVLSAAWPADWEGCVDVTLYAPPPVWTENRRMADCPDIEEVAVDKAQGMVPVQQLLKADEPPVGQILLVTQTPGRGMGHDDIHAAGADQGKPQLPYPFGHLPLRELPGSVGPILETAPETQDTQATVHHQLIVDAVAALRRAAAVPLVVVPVDVEKRRVGHGHQKGQIVRLQIPGGQDQVVSLQLSGGVVVPEGRALLVGHGQNAHGLHLMRQVFLVEA